MTVPPALVRQLSTRAINEHEAHRARGYREEVRPVTPRRLTRIHQLQVHLVHEHCRRYGTAIALSREVTTRDATQFVVNHRKERIERQPVDWRPG